MTDPDGGTFVQATWNWGDGSPATVLGAGSASQPVTHAFPNSSQYSVNLQVVDDQEQLGQFTLTVPVSNLNPIVNAGADQTTMAGQPLIFTSSVSRPGTLDVPSCTWAYGDGTTSAPSSDCNFNHTYTNVLPGQAAQTVTATLTATNTDGAVGTGSVHITITPGAPGLSTSGELFYTRYCGGPNVRQVQFSFDGTYGFTMQTPSTIASVSGADGVVFAPDGDLLVGGQGAVVHKVNPKTGAVQDGYTGGPAAFHLSLDPSGRSVWAASIPGEPSLLPLTPHSDGTPGLSIGTGSAHPLSGDNSIITSLAFVNGQAFYTASGSGGYGDVGVLDTNTYTTHRFISSLPAAHGMVYDRFTGHLLLFGSNHITQIDPATRAVVSDRYFSPATFGVNFDQGTADGKGHILIADNGGHLLFMDYSVKRVVGDPTNFVAMPYLDSCLDDVAPLSGVGSADELPPVSTLVATPPANTAGWNNTAVDLKFSATDTAANNVTPSGVARITAKDGSTDLACPAGASCAAQLTSEGTHTISYFATDNAGNVEAPPHSATIKIDRTPPQTTFQLAGGTRNADGSYSAAPNVTLIGTDPALTSGEPGSGVAATYYQVLSHTSGGQPPATTSLTGWSTYSGPFALAKDGDWDIWAVSADVAGNVAKPILVGEFVVSTATIVPPTGGGVTPGATPEVDSFMLLASGLAGLAGYAGLRQCARRRPVGVSSTRRRKRAM